MDEEEAKANEGPEILLPPDLELEMKSLSLEEETLDEFFRENQPQLSRCPVCIIIMTVFFTIINIALIIVGFWLASDKLSKALPCWIIASLLMLPTGYCYGLLIKAYYADPEERASILFEIPDI
ncbi:unnamed protein product [Blepharisma stoltei]|uniref:Transmembrane protein 230 n=1 Tax=Blepharisma stoltei TaxID=1481888 RepID=A0AAU9K8F4_9CILI|nr:unnamed protein product [Blepharisma stoltei]